MTIPANEPTQLRAGDTWEWTRSLGDYPATSWTLKYRFKHVSLTGFEITATASGTDHAVSVAASTTTGYAAGTYDWIAWVESGAVKKTVDQGRILVLADFRSGTAASALDGRSQARKTLEDLKTALAAMSANPARKSYTIGDVSVTFADTADIIRRISYWEAEVAREESAAAIATGLRSPNRVYVRSLRG